MRIALLPNAYAPPSKRCVRLVPLGAIRVPLVVTLRGETMMDADHAVRRFGLRPYAATVVPNGVELDDAEGPVPLDVLFGRFVFGLESHRSWKALSQLRLP